MKYRCISCNFNSEDEDHIFWVREWKTQTSVTVVLCKTCIAKNEIRKICDQFSVGDHV